MPERLRRKWGSALSCVVGLHGACDGFAAMRITWSDDVRCLCRCHSLSDTKQEAKQ